MCTVCIASNINRNMYMYLNTRIFPTTGYARVLLFMFIRRELGGTGTGCLFQFTYCDQVLCCIVFCDSPKKKKQMILDKNTCLTLKFCAALSSVTVQRRRNK